MALTTNLQPILKKGVRGCLDRRHGAYDARSKLHRTMALRIQILQLLSDALTFSEQVVPLCHNTC